MSFQRDVAIAEASGPRYGTYRTSFQSAGGQVSAHLFERDGGLVAHVAFTPGLKPEQVTDTFVADLNRYAQEHGYAGHPRLILAAD